MNEPKSYLIEIAGQMPDAIYERALQEVVRCRDCCWLSEDDSMWYCRNWGANIAWVEDAEPDGFCAWGARR